MFQIPSSLSCLTVQQDIDLYFFLLWFMGFFDAWYGMCRNRLRRIQIKTEMSCGLSLEKCYTEGRVLCTVQRFCVFLQRWLRIEACLSPHPAEPVGKVSWLVYVYLNLTFYIKAKEIPKFAFGPKSWTLPGNIWEAEGLLFLALMGLFLSTLLGISGAKWTVCMCV